MAELKVTPCEARFHVPTPVCITMESKALSAVFLTLIMLLSGCFGSGSDEPIEDSITEVKEITAAISLQITDSEISVGDIVLIEGTVEIYPADTTRNYEFILVSESGIRDIESTLSDTGEMIRLIFMPDEPGIWRISVNLVVDGLDDSVKEDVELSVLLPDEGNTILSLDSVIEMTSSAPLSIVGEVIHSDITSCTITDGSYSTTPNEDGDFTINLGLIEESTNVTITATCGKWTNAEDSRNVRIILLSGDDMDGDGIPDDSDSCPDGYGEDDGWNPNEITDRDGDGCHDFEEDIDDDNDLIPDVDDGCASEIGWVSTLENDYDQDGCNDTIEDSDDESIFDN